MNRLANTLFVLLISLALSACGTTPPLPTQLDGVYGGLFSAPGYPDSVAFAMDVTTTDSGSIYGDGALSDGYNTAYVSVTGTSDTSGNVNLTFTDVYNDKIYIYSQKSGRMFNGSWRMPSISGSGTIRYTDENNIDNLAHQNLALQHLPPLHPDIGGSLQDVLR